MFDLLLGKEGALENTPWWNDSLMRKMPSTNVCE
jgi:hypothetical protein